MIGLVWLTSVLYSTPKFLFVQTITNKLGNETGKRWNSNGQLRFQSSLFSQSTETICIVNRRDYNMKLFDILNFVLLYIVPLMVMTVSLSIFIQIYKRKTSLSADCHVINLEDWKFV